MIGSTVEAAYYALVNEYFFISTRKTPPLFYKELDTSLFGTRSDSEAWVEVNLALSFASKRLCFQDTSKIRITEEELKIVTGNTSFKYKYDKVYI